MSDTVIAPDLRERHEQLSKQLRGSKAQQRYAQFTHELIERVSKAEQENVALRAKVAKLEAPVSDEEWRDCSTFYDGTDHDYDTEAMERGSVDALIAARGREGE